MIDSLNALSAKFDIANIKTDAEYKYMKKYIKEVKAKDPNFFKKKKDKILTVIFRTGLKKSKITHDSRSFC